MGRAKQLWLTTPSAMKSPVPVAMSYIGCLEPQILDPHYAQIDGGLDHLAGDRTLTRDRRVAGVKEPQVLAQATPHTQAGETVGPAGAVLGGIEAQTLQARVDPRDNDWIGVGDLECERAPRALGVEDSGQEPTTPGNAREHGPADQLANALYRRARTRADRGHLTTTRSGRLEEALACLNAFGKQESFALSSASRSSSARRKLWTSP